MSDDTLLGGAAGLVQGATGIIAYVNQPDECEEGVASTTVHPQMTMRLPFSPASVPVARRRLNSWMVEGGLPADTMEDARLVLSELIANSVRHARPLSDGNLQVSWVLAGNDVELAVTDGGGPTVPRPVHAASSALAGRGMSIVDALSTRWWTERSSTRSTVHVRLPG